MPTGRVTVYDQGSYGYLGENLIRVFSAEDQAPRRETVFHFHLKEQNKGRILRGSLS